MKKFIKACIFILIFAILFYLVNKMLWLEATPISKFYDEPKDSLDVMYIGSSNVYAHFNTTLAYNLYGYTTGILSTDTQNFLFTKYLIKEAQKYQKPSLYVIDIAKLADDFEDFTEADFRKTFDSMKFSKNRIEAINEILSYKKDATKRDYINYYFSFFKYHNRMKRFPTQNIVGVKCLYKGYLLDNFNVEIKEQNVFYWSDETSKLQKQNKQILENLIQYIKEENLNVLFVVPKRYFDTDLNERLNDAIQIIEENNLKVINLNKIEDYNVIDFKTDFYNERHINVYGSTKNTIIFAKYLKENYDLPNHKGDSNYESWEDEYARFKEDFNTLTEKNFDEVLNNYKQQIEH